MSLLIDLTRCIGCDACTVACKQENGTPADVFFARVLNVEAGTYPDVKRVYLPLLCNHCENPACLKACPNKAIFRRDDGIVLIDQDQCKGTGACVSACPYGNIILTEKDNWYLNEDEPYEKDFVKPRIKENKARKCTLCAHRVDEGLEPACVVACPTTARIFGDLDDPNSKISRYVIDQKVETEREPFKLLPEAKTEPATLYLGTMAAQESSTLGNSPESQIAANASSMTEPLPKLAISGTQDSGDQQIKVTVDPEKLGHSAPIKPFGVLADLMRRAGKSVSVLLIGVVLATASSTLAKPDKEYLPVGSPAAKSAAAKVPGSLSKEGVPEVWSESSCASCHGPDAMGGLGPPLAGATLTFEQFENTVRNGKGMMPAVPQRDVPDQDLKKIYNYTHSAALDPSRIPVAYKVGALLSTRNTGIFFSLVTLIALTLAIKVLLYWVDCAGWKQLKPYLKKFGYLRAFGIMLTSLLLDGLCVRSLWRANKHRWAMHAFLIYGFIGLSLADFLMQICNPTRAEVSITHPIKILANLSGLAVLLGIAYVRYRYAKDKYIDNGLTIGRDYLFINLLALAILTGFLVEGLGLAGQSHWVQPFYMLHLTIIAVLFVSAPFTRFSHVFVVPVLIAMTRVGQAIAASGVDLGFSNEPSPGRHHKSERIAQQVMKQLEPNFKGTIKLRYYP
jgi:molybdopterin-containing oxidoreductase family iron-sulfur binding subunit